MPQDPADPRYLYEQIYSTLKGEILSGTYRKGDWFPPERVLKERFGTTHLTVRNALAKLVLEGYIERYSGKGTVVIYTREHPPAPRKTLRFPWAHLVLRDLDEINARFLECLDARMRRLPLPLQVSCHHGDVLLARGLCGQAYEAGALVVLEPAAGGPGPTELRPATILLRPAPDTSLVPTVAVDDAAGGRTAARHLLAAGHDAIAVVAEPGLAAGDRLYQGLLEELATQGRPAEAAVLQPCGPGVESGGPAARAVLARQPDCRAFLCGSDETAAGILLALRETGEAVPRRVHVVGRGNTRLARALQLTSIDLVVERLAELVVACVREGMARGELRAEEHRVIPELVVRSADR